MSPYRTTAEMFCDAMNYMFVCKDFDLPCDLTVSMVTVRYCVGSDIAADKSEVLFVDGSRAARKENGRWLVTGDVA